MKSYEISNKIYLYISHVMIKGACNACNISGSCTKVVCRSLHHFFEIIGKYSFKIFYLSLSIFVLSIPDYTILFCTA